jgi:carbonic anhydrase/acetyltransferase-like protein (isoleucine patch superfamily)
MRPMPLLSFEGHAPLLHPSVFLAPDAHVIGDVEAGEDSSIWFGTVVRGDVNLIRIGKRTNVQDLCVVHVTRGTHPTFIGDEVTVGHRVVLHGCRILDRCLIGTGAVVMDGAVVGEESLVGAGALVAQGTVIPPRTLALGVPARVARPLRAEEIAFLAQSAANYVGYVARWRASGLGS